MVIVDVQRMGPATGAPTTTAQGDIQFLRWSTSGGYSVIVLSPTNVQECYSLTRKAFDLAERFRTPVFVATSKEMVTIKATVDLDSYEETPVRDRKLAPADKEFVPYRFEQMDEVPAMSPFGGPHILRFSVASYDEQVFRPKDASGIARLNEHLEAKLVEHLDETALVKADLEEGSNTLIIGYGITGGAVVEAVRSARRQGIKVSSLIVHSLWPLPEKEIREAMATVSRIVVVELNLGQYRREIERLASDDQQVVGVHRVGGKLVSPAEILERGGVL